MTSAMAGQTDTDIFFCDLSPANRGPGHFFPTLLAVDFRGATWREPVLSQREESDVYSRKRDGLFGNVIQSSARR